MMSTRMPRSFSAELNAARTCCTLACPLGAKWETSHVLVALGCCEEGVRPFSCPKPHLPLDFTASGGSGTGCQGPGVSLRGTLRGAAPGRARKPRNSPQKIFLRNPAPCWGHRSLSHGKLQGFSAFRTAPSSGLWGNGWQPPSWLWGCGAWSPAEALGSLLLGCLGPTASGRGGDFNPESKMAWDNIYTSPQSCFYFIFIFYFWSL